MTDKPRAGNDDGLAAHQCGGSQPGAGGCWPYPDGQRHAGAQAGGPGSVRDHDAAAMVADVYEQLRTVARAFFLRQPPGHDLQPTALVHEAVLKVLRCQTLREEVWSSPEEVLRIFITTMRRTLVDCARTRAGRRTVPLPGAEFAGAGAPPGASGLNIDPAALSEALDELGEIDPRAADVVTLRYFFGLTVPETARSLGIGVSTAENDWRVARAWLLRALHRRTGQAG